MHEPGDLEGLAESVYVETGFDPMDPPTMGKLGRALFRDPTAVQLVPRHALRWAEAALVLVQGKWKVMVRSGCAPALVGFFVGHELAHWILRREGLEDDEQSCDYLGSALVAPRPAFHAALREFGPDLGALAERFGTTESLCLLRLGETTGRNLALVRPGLVRVRGQLSFVWPDENTLRRWASEHTPPGLAKAPALDGDRRRIGLIVND